MLLVRRFIVLVLSTCRSIEKHYSRGILLNFGTRVPGRGGCSTATLEKRFARAVRGPRAKRAAARASAGARPRGVRRLPPGARAPRRRCVQARCVAGARCTHSAMGLLCLLASSVAGAETAPAGPGAALKLWPGHLCVTLLHMYTAN